MSTPPMMEDVDDDTVAVGVPNAARSEPHRIRIVDPSTIASLALGDEKTEMLVNTAWEGYLLWAPSPSIDEAPLELTLRRRELQQTKLPRDEDASRARANDDDGAATATGPAAENGDDDIVADLARSYSAVADAIDAHTRFSEDDTDLLRRRVVQTATHAQRCAMRALLAAAMGRTARNELDALTGLVLPPPYQTPAEDHPVYGTGASAENDDDEFESSGASRGTLLALAAHLEPPHDIPPLPAGPAENTAHQPAAATRRIGSKEGYLLLREAVVIMPTSLAIQLGVGYSGVHRSAARRLCQLLRVDFDSVVCVHERSMCGAMIAAANNPVTEAERAATDKSLDRNKIKVRLWKGLKIGAFVVAGGALCVVTGGLAAAALGPALVGVAGAIGAAAAAATAGLASLLGTGAFAAVLIGAVAAVGQAAVVCLLIAPIITSTALPTVFGASGATLAGYRASSRIGEVVHFRLRYVASSSERDDVTTKPLELGRQNSEDPGALEGTLRYRQEFAHGRVADPHNETEKRTGFNMLVSAFTRERRTVSSAVVPVRQVSIAHANLASEVNQFSLLALGILNRIGEHVALAALRTRAAEAPKPPPIDVLVVRRLTLLGACRFAPAPSISPGYASVSVFHNRPKFPTGAEAIVVLRPVLSGAGTASNEAQLLGDSDIWVYGRVSLAGTFTASVAAFPRIAEAAWTDTDSSNALTRSDEDADGANGDDGDNDDDDDHEALLNATVRNVPVVDIASSKSPEPSTYSFVMDPTRVRQLISAQIRSLRREATKGASEWRDRLLVVTVKPDTLSCVTVRLVADELAEEETTAFDPGYRSLDDAAHEAAKVLASREAVSARRKAAVVVRFGAEDETDDEEADAGDTMQVPKSADAFDDTILQMHPRSFVLDRIEFSNGTTLPALRQVGSKAGNRHATCPSDRTPREVPRRRAIVVPFRNERMSVPVPNVYGATMIMRLRHRELEPSGKVLYLITAVTVTDSVESAAVFAADDRPVSEVVSEVKLKPLPVATSDRAMHAHRTVYDHRVPSHSRFSVAAWQDPVSGAVVYCIADEVRRRLMAVRQRMAITVAVPGFSLFFDPGKTIMEQQLEIWRRRLQQWHLARGSERYVLEWDPEVLHRFGVRIDTDVLEGLSDMPLQELKGAAMEATMAVVSSFLAAFSMPKRALKAISYIDNSIATLTNRSISAGQELAAALVSPLVGRRPVTLVGFSFGAVVVLECAKHLIRMGKAHILESVVCLGATAAVPRSTWLDIRRCVAGRVVNVYNNSDMLLSALLRLNNVNTAGYLIAGLNPVDVPGVENVDASSIVSSHIQYATRLADILALIPPEPTLAVLRPSGHNPGAVVPTAASIEAAVKLAGTLAPPALVTSVARGLGMASTAPISVVVVSLESSESTHHHHHLQPHLPHRHNNCDVTRLRLELIEDRVLTGDGCWGFAPPHAVPCGQAFVFGLRGEAHNNAVSEEQPALAAYCVYRLYVGGTKGKDAKATQGLVLMVLWISEGPAVRDGEPRSAPTAHDGAVDVPSTTSASSAVPSKQKTPSPKDKAHQSRQVSVAAHLLPADAPLRWLRAVDRQQCAALASAGSRSLCDAFRVTTSRLSSASHRTGSTSGPNAQVHASTIRAAHESGLDQLIHRVVVTNALP
jgi:hypothetical protein